jgi:NUDIX domain
MSKQNTILESIAKILIINGDGNVLTLTLSEHLKYPEKSNQPDLPGGIVDAGEPENLGVIREVQEECGIDLDSAKIQLAYAETTYDEKENKSVTKLLYVTHLDNTPAVTLSWEHSDKWVSVAELLNIDMRPFFNQAIQYVIERKII